MKANVISTIRKAKAPRKKRLEQSEPFKRYAAIQLPVEQVEKLMILKKAYEMAWAGSPDFESMSHSEIEQWSPEHITMEEFFERLYYGAIRADGSSLKKYIPLAERAVKATTSMKIKTRAGEDDVLRRLAAGEEPHPEEKVGSEAAAKPQQPRCVRFVKGGSWVEAHPGDLSPFYATIDNRNVGYRPMIKDGWTLVDADGAPVRDYDAANALSAKLKG